MLLCWSNDHRGSSGNNAEQGLLNIGGNTRNFCVEAAFLHITATSRLLKLLKDDDRAILTAAARAEEAASLLLKLGGRTTFAGDSDDTSDALGDDTADVLAA